MGGRLLFDFGNDGLKAFLRGLVDVGRLVRWFNPQDSPAKIRAIQRVKNCLARFQQIRQGGNTPGELNGGRARKPPSSLVDTPAVRRRG